MLPRTHGWRPRLLLALGLASAGAPSVAAHAQEDPYRDPGARSLHEAAMDNRERWDDSVVDYTAVVRQRVGVALRTPLKDRTLYRVESAHRIFWKREGDLLVQVLALREQTPVGVLKDVTNHGLFDQPFDPINDRLFFGFVPPDEDFGEPGDRDFWFEHPLFPEYRDSYRFATGDTLTLSLPDGRTIRAVELQVVPEAASVHRMTGSLWIEPGSGALVRAVYRLSEQFDALRDIADLREEEDDDLKYVPGLFKPWTVDLSLVAVDYALWDGGVWLPRSLRAEGVAKAGILAAPATVDIGYEIESLTTDADLERANGGDAVETVRFRTRAEAMQYVASLSFGDEVEYELDGGWSENNGRRVRYLVPRDPSLLAVSPELPPPVWKDAPGFASQAELEALFDNLADLPTAPVREIPRTLRWGLQRPDLVRYNRVEALSLGARGQLRPQTFAGPLSLTATGRLGLGDLEPNGRLDVTRETIERRTTVSFFHELAALDERARHLGIGNSLLAATIGRDDGDYYRRSGMALEFAPPSAERRSWRVLAYSEYQRAVQAETEFALFRWGSDAFRFRDNLPADEGWEHGGVVELHPWWGSDPRLAQAGLDLVLQAAGGDRDYAKASLTGRLALPLPADTRLGIEIGGGTAWGDPTVQRLWYLGGPATLRGYEPRSLGGASYLRGRAELARTYSFGSVSIFSDLGWAGDRERIHLDDALYSLGAGLSILDGLIRLDAAWGARPPRDFRFDLYLDAIL